MKVKKTISFLLSILLIMTSVASFVSCEQTIQIDEKPKIIGTIFPLYDFARQITGDLADCEMLLPPGADSHSYTGENPSDILRISQCDIFIYIGGESDAEWVERVRNSIESSGDTSPLFISLYEACDLLEETSEGIVDTDSDSDEHEIEYDDHVWTSPLNVIKAVQAVTDAVCSIDPDNRNAYSANSSQYIEKLETLDSSFNELFLNCKKEPVLVFADRFPFRYFADRYSLKCYAAFNGCASQSEPSPSVIAKLCSIVQELKLSYVFYIETSRSNIPDLICDSAGCSSMLLHSCHSVTQSEIDRGATYLSIMEQNLNNLRKAFGNE